MTGGTGGKETGVGTVLRGVMAALLGAVLNDLIFGPPTARTTKDPDSQVDLPWILGGPHRGFPTATAGPRPLDQATHAPIQEAVPLTSATRAVGRFPLQVSVERAAPPGRFPARG